MSVIHSFLCTLFSLNSLWPCYLTFCYLLLLFKLFNIYYSFLSCLYLTSFIIFYLLPLLSFIFLLSFRYHLTLPYFCFSPNLNVFIIVYLLPFLFFIFLSPFSLLSYMSLVFLLFIFFLLQSISLSCTFLVFFPVLCVLFCHHVVITKRVEFCGEKNVK